MAKSSLIVITTSQSLRDDLRKDLGDDFNLSVLHSGENALRAIQKRMPSAIVMDHSLEDYLTYRFIDKVRNNPVTRNLPFIIVSRESSHSFVEQAVRSGVSHYIGIPYEKKILIEKIKAALNSGDHRPTNSYFSLPVSMPTHVLSYGRISYIAKTGIHLETHLKLSPGDILQLQSPLSEAISEQVISVQVTGISSDVFYNYPFAVDAVWQDLEVEKKIHSWMSANKALNSPKKSKILFICSDQELETSIADALDKNQYSPRFEFSLAEGVLSLPYLKPACVVIDTKCWKDALNSIQQKFLKTSASPWMLFGSDEGLKVPEIGAPLLIPGEVGAIAGAVRSFYPPPPPEPDRLYLSKMLEDSRVKIHVNGKIRVLGEMGVELALEREVHPPCNFQLDLKTFTDQNFRNPFIRAWPPTQKLSAKESDGGKLKVAMESHFLGINDQQAQAIRLWLRDEELKERRRAIADIAPKPKPTTE